MVVRELNDYMLPSTNYSHAGCGANWICKVPYGCKSHGKQTYSRVLVPNWWCCSSQTEERWLCGGWTWEPQGRGCLIQPCLVWASKVWWLKKKTFLTFHTHSERAQEELDQTPPAATIIAPATLAKHPIPKALADYHIYKQNLYWSKSEWKAKPLFAHVLLENCIGE